MFGVLNAASHLRLIVRKRELFFLAGIPRAGPVKSIVELWMMSEGIFVRNQYFDHIHTLGR